ncbi:MAG TPA: hypothetical protein VFP80_13265 [Thermoanaerobaculia bacterium]|nr:hypothetical protein [Thermoanaerobaculia bacterium]
MNASPCEMRLSGDVIAPPAMRKPALLISGRNACASASANARRNPISQIE